ncbi:uncharacterized protein LOC119834502 [Zerene cesonia]|uniref:uncharacterized protein LOC119834502 n=1 Tax=Zerene cesonia TaxID=33412 RepID=UPI0018E524FC|nr:uncharacterized protein LOC119834502 [Zerene cesonia]
MCLVRSFNILLFVALLQTSRQDPSPVTPLYKQVQIPNASNPRDSLSSIASIFSPRMDFEQWKPLTGRGDPLRNDPTYDYEPPMLEKVHYWADDTRHEHERFPEKKSEVLVLGVSSRKPSVSSRPPIPPRRHHLSPPAPPPKYEDFQYKFNEHYPMTILVPPPPPPAGYKPSLFLHHETKLPRPTTTASLVEATLPPRYTVSAPELITSFALQEANLIYQATDVNQTWFINFNKTQTVPSNTVSSDYAGWGPTTPLNEENSRNVLHNLIPHSERIKEVSKNTLYKPSYTETEQAPPTEKTQILATFLPTVLPPIETTTTDSRETWSYEESSDEVTTESQVNYSESDTQEITTNYIRQSQSTYNSTARPQPSVVDMLGAMMSMPMVADPDRPEDNLYAHASENIQVFKDHTTEEGVNLEIMQTMQPPPPVSQTLSTPSHKQPYHVNPHILNSLLNENQQHLQTHDPYLHMRYTTPLTPTTEQFQDIKQTTEATPMYLIIQGHSKVKTYGSKPNPASNAITDSDISKPHETNEVKHLHPIKDKNHKKIDSNENSRSGRSQNLTALIDAGVGSIEIQEADVGIKYDVSDGSKVPVEIYRKGIVESDENNYSLSKKHLKRDRRQVDLSDFIPFDDDTLEDFVYKFFETRKNDTGITGFIAKAITGDVATAVKDAFKEDNEERNYQKR